MPRGKTKTKKCDKCGGDYSLFGYNSHYNKCNGIIITRTKLRDVPIDLKCEYCDFVGKNKMSYIKHVDYCNNNPNKKIPPKVGKRGSNQHIKAKEQGLPIFVSKETREKISKAGKGRKHSIEVKEKISKSRQKFLAENPDMVPYKLNHYSKGSSYPERYWEKLLTKYGVSFHKQFQIHTYQLDFALIDKKIDIEVDGEQHYLDERIVKSDKRRNEFLKKHDWTILRIRWAEYRRLSLKERKRYVKEIITKLK